MPGIDKDAMKKIALPVTGNMLEPHFGHCRNFKIYHVDDQKVIKEEILEAPKHETGVLPNFLAIENITDLIVGGIGHKAIQYLNQYKINVFVGASIKDTGELVNDYLEGMLGVNANLCDH